MLRIDTTTVERAETKTQIWKKQQLLYLLIHVEFRFNGKVFEDKKQIKVHQYNLFLQVV